MAAPVQFRLNSAGIAEILRSAGVAALVGETAAAVAAAADGQGHTVRSGARLPIKVEQGVTDRAAATVTIAHPAGQGMQAKYGVLTRAAAQAGLDVRARR